MVACSKSGLVCAVRIAVAMSVALTLACRQRALPDTGNADAAGEPEQYSATVVRIVENGTTSETITSREARAGDKRREEWTENGQNRALIWRPDIGKAFLLDLDRRVYVEIYIGDAPSPELRDRSGDPHGVSTQKPADLDARDSTVQAIDQYFSDTQPPTRVEIQTLSPTIIDGHPCVVYQQRAIYPDGHTETTRKFHARDLSGLLLRVESEAEQRGSKVITERRDVRIEVPPDEFIVPADFKRVEMLPR